MKKINFIYLNEYAFDVCEKPYPAIKNIPDWYKKMMPYAPSKKSPQGKIPDVSVYNSNASAKKCIPMRDAITSGYIVPLWSDVIVDSTDEQDISIKWRVAEDVFSFHNTYGANLIPPPEGYSTSVFKFIPHLRVETPPGYSIFVMPPSGYYQLPFHAIPAIIDSDKSKMDLALPVWVKKDLNCVIEKGTPIAQIIPFKRDDWQSSFSMISSSEWKRQMDKFFHSTIVNNYFKNFWSRKTFK